MARKVTLERALEATRSDEYIGFCLACGAEHEGIDLDAHGVECEVCGKPKVYGAEELVLLLS